MADWQRDKDFCCRITNVTIPVLRHKTYRKGWMFQPPFGNVNFYPHKFFKLLQMFPEITVATMCDQNQVTGMEITYFEKQILLYLF